MPTRMRTAMRVLTLTGAGVLAASVMAATGGTASADSASVQAAAAKAATANNAVTSNKPVPASVSKALKEMSSASQAKTGVVAPTAGDGSTANARRHLKAGKKLLTPLVGTKVKGKAAPESVIGTDDRVQITATTTYPNSAVVMITRNGNAHCSGWMAGPNLVVTAGHCVNTGAGGSWYSGLTVWPGRNGSYAPYGGCSARQLYSVYGWTGSGDQNYDYGAIKLNCTIGYNTGTFGYYWQSASLNGTLDLINGYPGEKAFGTQWRGDLGWRSILVSNATKVWYQNDTTGGMSGSGIYTYRNGGWYMLGIHGYGLGGGYPSNVYNSGRRIDSYAFNNINAWRNAA